MNAFYKNAVWENIASILPPPLLPSSALPIKSIHSTIPPPKDPFLPSPYNNNNHSPIVIPFDKEIVRVADRLRALIAVNPGEYVREIDFGTRGSPHGAKGGIPLPSIRRSSDETSRVIVPPGGSFARCV